VTPEAAVYLQAVAGVSNTRTPWEHSQHMGRDGRARFFKAARALRESLPEEEANEEIAKLAAKMGVAQ
jgi:hypothetical protein